MGYQELTTPTQLVCPLSFHVTRGRRGYTSCQIQSAFHVVRDQVPSGLAVLLSGACGH